MKNEWPMKMLGGVCENLDSKRVPITKNKRTAGEYPYYGASGVVDHVAAYLFDENLLLVSEYGANLLVRTYPIAFSVSGKVWVNNHAHTFCGSLTWLRNGSWSSISIRSNPIHMQVNGSVRIESKVARFLSDRRRSHSGRTSLPNSTPFE